jgi:hypothetical protein
MNKNIKIQLIAMVSLIIAMLACVPLFRWLNKHEDIKTLVLIWFFLGAVLSPRDIKNEWQYWAWSPLLGLARLINVNINEFFRIKNKMDRKENYYKE